MCRLCSSAAQAFWSSFIRGCSIFISAVSPHYSAQLFSHFTVGQLSWLSYGTRLLRKWHSYRFWNTLSVREGCQGSRERLSRWLLDYRKIAFTFFCVQSTFWIACNERENSKTTRPNLAIFLSSIPKSVIRLFELVSNTSSAVSHTVPLCIQCYLIHIFLYVNEICVGHKFILF